MRYLTIVTSYPKPKQRPKRKTSPFVAQASPEALQRTQERKSRLLSDLRFFSAARTGFLAARSVVDHWQAMTAMYSISLDILISSSLPLPPFFFLPLSSFLCSSLSSSNRSHRSHGPYRPHRSHRGHICHLWQEVKRLVVVRPILTTSSFRFSDSFLLHQLSDSRARSQEHKTTAILTRPAPRGAHPPTRPAARTHSHSQLEGTCSLCRNNVSCDGFMNVEYRTHS